MRITCVGLSTVDLIYRVPVIPGPDQKAQATSITTAAGGPALNAAVTAAALGADVTLVTAAGAHPLAAVIRDDLAERGVTLIDAAPASTDPPPLTAITVEEHTGRRTIVSRNAAAVFPAPPFTFEGVVLADGHHPSLALAAAASADTLILDAGHWRPVFADLLPRASMVVASSGFALPSGGALRDVAPHVAITDGPRPVRWWSGSESGTVPVPPVTAEDTSGAGDAFHGALAVAVAGGSSFVAALSFAVDVATLRVQHAGPRTWLSDPRLQSL